MKCMQFYAASEKTQYTDRKVARQEDAGLSAEVLFKWFWVCSEVGNRAYAESEDRGGAAGNQRRAEVVYNSHGEDSTSGWIR